MVCCMHATGPCTNANDFEMTFATIESYDVWYDWVMAEEINVSLRPRVSHFTDDRENWIAKSEVPLDMFSRGQ
jgi:hypothetical protein